MKKFTYLKLALATIFLFIEISTSFGNIRHGILLTNADQQDAIDAYQQFKQGLTSQHTADPSSMLRHYRKTKTRGEYQSWSLIMAVMFDDLETAEKLWNFCKYYIPRQNYGMVPWLIKKNYDSFGGHSVGDADFDYCIALDMAARKWPDWVGDDGHDWDYWAKYYINQVYEVKRSVVDDPSSINALSGKKIGDVDEHYYLHYSPYGYLNNWRDRTGQKNWTEEVDGLESVYDAEINLQKITLAKYYGTSQDNLYCWPPHQVRKDGYAADDLTKKYDSGWNMMNWGPSRITLRACHAYINNGDAHGAKMMRFMADRWWEETDGDPAKIKFGYSLNKCGGWGDPTAWMIGGAAVVSMVDEQYRPMLDNMYDALVNLNVSGDRHAQLAKAYYLMHLTGLMDFAIGSCQSVTGVSITNAPSQMDLNDELRLTVDFQPSNVCNRGLQWSSSNSDVATVDQSGNIHAIAEGTVTITVTSNDGGYSDEVTINIIKTIPPSSISIDQSSVSLSPAETIQLNATVLPEDVTYSGVTWTSSNENIATVDTTGLVTAISDGNANITATTEDGSLSDICVVNVMKGQTLNFSNSSELPSNRFYPNPVSGGTLYLADYADIKLFNMQGKVLLEKHHVNSVDVSDLQQGIYLLSIGTTFRKIVIE
ncbi:MAG: glycosyl hydrolase family 8 [Bacteroidota bacterium]